jgi:hypothetical protein
MFGVVTSAVIAHDSITAVMASHLRPAGIQAGAFGGSSPDATYRRYVTAGLSEPLESPWNEAYHGWILGSRAFINRVAAMVSGEPRRE